MDGEDVTDTPREFSNAESLSNVQVVVTKRITEVSGSVTDDRRRPVPDCTVIFFSTDETKLKPGSRRRGTARPDQSGRYRVPGLPAGEYFAVAVEWLPAGDADDPDVLSELRRHAVRVSLGDGEEDGGPEAGSLNRGRRHEGCPRYEAKLAARRPLSLPEAPSVCPKQGQPPVRRGRRASSSGRGVGVRAHQWPERMGVGTRWPEPFGGWRVTRCERGASGRAWFAVMMQAARWPGRPGERVGIEPTTRRLGDGRI